MRIFQGSFLGPPYAATRLIDGTAELRHGLSETSRNIFCRVCTYRVFPVTIFLFSTTAKWKSSCKPQFVPMPFLPPTGGSIKSRNLKNTHKIWLIRSFHEPRSCHVLSHCGRSLYVTSAHYLRLRGKALHRFSISLSQQTHVMTTSFTTLQPRRVTNMSRFHITSTNIRRLCLGWRDIKTPSICYVSFNCFVVW